MVCCMLAVEISDAMSNVAFLQQKSLRHGKNTEELKSLIKKAEDRLQGLKDRHAKIHIHRALK